MTTTQYENTVWGDDICPELDAARTTWVAARAKRDAAQSKLDAARIELDAARIELDTAIVKWVASRPMRSV